MLWKQFSPFLRIVIALLVLSSSTLYAQDRFDTIQERLDNRSFPSVFSTWAGPSWRRVFNRPDLSGEEVLALHDIYWTHSWVGVRWHYMEETDTLELKGVLPTDVAKAERTQRQMERINPNMIYLMEIRMKTAVANTPYPPQDSYYWVHNSKGEWVKQGDRALVDFVNPKVQDMIVKQAVNIQESGLFDGIMFDWWVEDFSILDHYRTVEAQRTARENILRRIREAVHPDFLILVNTNDRRIPLGAPYINGAFMETAPHGRDRSYPMSQILKIEDSARWLSKNLREPRIVCLEGRATPGTKDLDNDVQKRWMRFFTTMGLIFTDGSVLYALAPGHWHNWYDFWDVSLGQPIGEKNRLYENIVGCFIREYDNGWAVYNRSLKTQVITLPDVTAAVSTGKYDYIHEVPSIDGEIFLRAHPTHVHPSNLLTLTWGELKR